MKGLLKLCDMSCGSLPDRMLLEKGSEEHQVGLGLGWGYNAQSCWVAYQALRSPAGLY